MDLTIKFFDEKGKPLTGAELDALPVGTTYYRSVGGSLREKLVR
jgi:hypothetical protein